MPGLLFRHFILSAIYYITEKYWIFQIERDMYETTTINLINCYGSI